MTTTDCRRQNDDDEYCPITPSILLHDDVMYILLCWYMIKLKLPFIQISNTEE